MPRWSRCAIAPEAKTIHRLLETDPRTGAFRRTEEAGAEPAIARSVPTRCDPDWEEFAPDSPLEGAGFEPWVPLEVLTVGIVPCRLRGPFHASLPKTKFAADSAREERRFEPSVPLPRAAGQAVDCGAGFHQM